MTTKMRPLREIISLDEARARIAAAVRPIDRIERVPLADADGRVLAESLVATADVPPFAHAAMDGYAVRAGDSSGATRDQPRTFTRIETLFTGEVSTRTVGPGECIEIATGAPMPAGADAVVIVEETDGEASGTVRVFSVVSPRQNVGPQGADIRQGQQVLQEGTTLTPGRVGAAAALGLSAVSVYARPRVALLSTGNAASASSLVRSTTSTDLPWRPSWPPMAASRSPIERPTTALRSSPMPWTPASVMTCSSSPAAALSVSGI